MIFVSIKDLCSAIKAFIYAFFDRCERLSKPSHFSAVSVLPFESLDEKPTSSFNPDVMTSMHESLLYTLLFFKPGTEFLIPWPRRKYECNSGDTKPIFFLMSQILSPLPRLLSNKPMILVYACGVSAVVTLNKTVCAGPLAPARTYASP